MAQPITIVPWPFYKPLATRTYVLFLYLIATLGLLVLIEYACQRIPNHTGAGSLSSAVNYTQEYLSGRDLATCCEVKDLKDLNAQYSEPSRGKKHFEPRQTAPDPTSYYASNGFLTFSGDKTTSNPEPVTIFTIEPTTSGYLSLEGDSTTSIPEPTISESAMNGFLSVGGNGKISALSATDTSTSTIIMISAPATPFDGYLSTSRETYARVTSTSVEVIKTTQTTLDYTVIPTTITGFLKPTATIVNSAGTFLLMSDGSVEIPPQISALQYIIVAFLPLILAVVFTFPWRILDTTIREMEPFYQLRRPGGAPAEHSILLDYTTSSFITTPFKSIYRRHYYVFCSALISIAVLIIVPLSSEALFVSLSGDCGVNKVGPCHATWGIYPILARTMEAILAFIVVLVSIMMLCNSYRSSGVYANPLSIAGLGTLFQNPAVLREFASIDSRASNSALRKLLMGRIYTLSFTTLDGVTYYGLSNPRENSEVGQLSALDNDTRGKYSIVISPEQVCPDPSSRLNGDESEEKISRSAGISDRLVQVGTLFIVMGLLTMITYYHWTSGDTGFERFMDSQGFGIRFLMTSVGVIIKLFWSNVDEALRRTEPYRRLLEGTSKPLDSILVYTYMSPISALLPSLLRRHFLVSLGSFNSLLSEVLPITLANIPFSPAATREAYSICTYIAMAILTLIMASLFILIFRGSHNLHHLPRQPVTIAGVLLYMVTTPYAFQGSMLESLSGLATLGGKERDDTVRSMGKVYGLGYVGPTELRIDVEERIPRP